MEEDQQQSSPASPNGSNKFVFLFVILVIVVLLGFGAYSVMNMRNQNNTEKAVVPTVVELSPEVPSATAMPASDSAKTEASASSVMKSTSSADLKASKKKEFAIEGSSFKFSPNAFTVKKGDTVVILFKNTGGTHDFVIDEFNAKTKQIQNAGSDTIEFVADKAGTFEFYCSVGNHRAMGMKGTLTVTQ